MLVLISMWCVLCLMFVRICCVVLLVVVVLIRWFVWW